MAVNKDNPIFPPVPLKFDLISWSNWAQAVTQFLKKYVLNFNQPAVPSGVVATQSGLGILVTWNASNNADSYRIYRNSSASIASATIVTEVFGHETLRYYDEPVQFIASTQVYWVQALNKIRQTSLVSLPASIATVSAAANSGIGYQYITGALLVGTTMTVLGGSLPYLEVAGNSADLVLHGSATTGYSEILFYRAGHAKAVIGCAGTPSGFITGDNANDLVFNGANNIDFAVNNMTGGARIAMFVTSNGGITVQSGTGADPTGASKGAGTVNVATGYFVNGANKSGSFTTVDGKTVTVTGGIITNIV